jgi:hypothetical protein
MSDKIEVEKLGHPDAAVTKHAPPTKTPMYEAVSIDRYQRQAEVRLIQSRSNSRLLCYVAGPEASISRDDTLGIVDLLYNVPKGSNIDLLLHTGGGNIDAAEKIVSMIRSRVGTGYLRVIVPDFAKSAGTLIALAADKIVMGDSSELGPVDPQIVLADGRGNRIQHSVISYLKAYKTNSEALEANPADPVAKIMLEKLDPATLHLFQMVLDRARILAEKHLSRWMKKPNYTAIACDLMDVDANRWQAHGQMIGWEDAQQIGLEVQYMPPEDAEWRAYWRLYCLQRLGVKDRQKLFESDFASLLMEDGSA